MTVRDYQKSEYFENADTKPYLSPMCKSEGKEARAQPKLALAVLHIFQNILFLAVRIIT